MTKEEIDIFEKVQVQLSGIHKEVSILSKKNPNDAINKFKLNFINELLQSSNYLLVDTYKPFINFDIFKEEDVPTNSDVVMIVEQYLSCLENLRADNIKFSTYSYYWVIDGKISENKTTIPDKLKEKK